MGPKHRKSAEATPSVHIIPLPDERGKFGIPAARRACGEDDVRRLERLEDGVAPEASRAELDDFGVHGKMCMSRVPQRGDDDRDEARARGSLRTGTV